MLKWLEHGLAFQAVTIVSEILQLNENIEYFLKLECLPRNGIMEWWNTGRLVFKRIVAIFNFMVNTNYTINLSEP
jgi:hypothetical protein